MTPIALFCNNTVTVKVLIPWAAEASISHLIARAFSPLRPLSQFLLLFPDSPDLSPRSAEDQICLLPMSFVGFGQHRIL